MDEYDQRIVKIKLKQIEFSLNLITNRLPKTLDEFLSMDILVRDGIYKRVEFIIQNILDILAIFTKYVGEIPGNDEDIIRILQKAGIIDTKLAKIIRQMKAFRNFLVHRYGNLFDEIAFRDISTGIKDIIFVMEKIREILNKIDP